ncbi:MAG: hypothetical protein J6P05_03445 [Lachnospiraceae bacterium]|nr:hypothetical protein [Lachnospiraceae bacterium]
MFDIKKKLKNSIENIKGFFGTVLRNDGNPSDWDDFFDDKEDEAYRTVKDEPDIVDEIDPELIYKETEAGLLMSENDSQDIKDSIFEEIERKIKEEKAGNFDKSNNDSSQNSLIDENLDSDELKTKIEDEKADELEKHEESKDKLEISEKSDDSNELKGSKHRNKNKKKRIKKVGENSGTEENIDAKTKNEKSKEQEIKAKIDAGNETESKSAAEQKREAANKEDKDQKQEAAITGDRKQRQKAATKEDIGQKQEVATKEDKEKKQKIATAGDTDKKQETATEGDTEKKQEIATEGDTEKKQEIATEGDTEKKQEIATEGDTEKKQEIATEGDTEKKQEIETERDTEQKQKIATEGDTEKKQEITTEGDTEKKQEIETEGEAEQKQERATEGEAEQKQEAATETDSEPILPVEEKKKPMAEMLSEKLLLALAQELKAERRREPRLLSELAYEEIKGFISSISVKSAVQALITMLFAAMLLLYSGSTLVTPVSRKSLLRNLSKIKSFTARYTASMKAYDKDLNLMKLYAVGMYKSNQHDWRVYGWSKKSSPSGRERNEFDSYGIYDEAYDDTDLYGYSLKDQKWGLYSVEFNPMDAQDLFDTDYLSSMEVRTTKAANILEGKIDSEVVEGFILGPYLDEAYVRGDNYDISFIFDIKGETLERIRIKADSKDSIENPESGQIVDMDIDLKLRKIDKTGVKLKSSAIANLVELDQEMFTSLFGIGGIEDGIKEEEEEEETEPAQEPAEPVAEEPEETKEAQQPAEETAPTFVQLSLNLDHISENEIKELAGAKSDSVAAEMANYANNYTPNQMLYDEIPHWNDLSTDKKTAIAYFVNLSWIPLEDLESVGINRDNLLALIDQDRSGGTGEVSENTVSDDGLVSEDELENEELPEDDLPPEEEVPEEEVPEEEAPEEETPESTLPSGYDPGLVDDETYYEGREDKFSIAMDVFGKPSIDRNDLYEASGYELGDFTDQTLIQYLVHFFNNYTREELYDYAHDNWKSEEPGGRKAIAYMARKGWIERDPILGGTVSENDLDNLMK